MHHLAVAVQACTSEWPAGRHHQAIRDQMATPVTARAPTLKAFRRSRNHMNLRSLAIAAAVAFLSAGTAAQVLAQQPNNNPPAAAAPAAAPAQPAGANAGANGAPAPAAATAPADQPAANNPPPAVNPPATGGAASGVGGNSPYGLFALWRGGDFVIRAVIVLLGIMSIGTWYIFFMKFWE